MAPNEVASATNLPVPLSEATQKLDEMKQSMRRDAKQMISKGIPERIDELNKLLKSADFSLTHDQYVCPVNVPCPPGLNQERVSGDPVYLETGVMNGTKLLVLPDGVIHLNATLDRLQKAIKPIIIQLIDDCNLLRMWIQLLIPKVEDGNNFGVGIQEECLMQVSEVQKDSSTYIDHVTRYHLTRAKVASKVAKYPHVDDFRRTAEELDEKQYQTLTLFVQQIRNDYSVLHDVLTKNMEKILKPRNFNAESLY